jgi:S1-C subfamily serine protease
MAETINGYNNNLIINNKVTVVFNSADYDLAVVKLISDNDYTVMPFASEDASVGDKIISIGAPLGVVNSVTAGEVVKTDKKIETSSPEVSNVTFNVITHNAYLNDGSSGGVLMNYNYEIVGINFATGKSSNTGEFVEGYAVPVSKVVEFLTLNGLN